jgi:hypothetical protein
MSTWDLLDALAPQACQRAEPLLCAVCFGLPRRPSHPDSCGHIFCEACLRASLQRRAECPVCRAGAEKPIFATAVAELLLASEAQCPRCPAQLPLASLDAHLDLHVRAEALDRAQARCEQLQRALDEAREELAAVRGRHTGWRCSI